VRLLFKRGFYSNVAYNSENMVNHQFFVAPVEVHNKKKYFDKFYIHQKRKLCLQQQKNYEGEFVRRSRA